MEDEDEGEGEDAGWASEYTRRPSRQAKEKKVNYRVDNSDDEDEEEEADEEEEEEEDEEERAVDEARQARQVEAQSDAYAIERVLDSRPRASRSAQHTLPTPTSVPHLALSPLLCPVVVCSGVVEYLIQWHGDSHLYDTWHTESEVEELCASGRGLKKLSNFIARERETLLQMQSVSREEVEQMNVAAEMMRQEREEWVKVEKVIASRECPTHIVKQLQRIRKRRRTFTLGEQEEEVEGRENEEGGVKVGQEEEQKKQPMMVEEKEEEQQRVAVVKREAQAEGMRTEEEAEEKAITCVATTHSAIIPQPPLSSPSPSAPPDARMVIDTGPDVSAAMKDEEEAAAKMEDDQPTVDAVTDVADAAEETVDGVQKEEEEEEDDDEELYDDGTTVTQYLVKWRGLAHEDCTWESAEAISAYQACIDDFLDLEQLTSARGAGGQLSRKFRKLDVQPAYLQQGQLREYQLEGLNWLIHNWCKQVNSSQQPPPPPPHSLHPTPASLPLSAPLISPAFCPCDRRCAVLADEMGLGKCWAAGTLLRMFDGSVQPVEAIVAGDLLMGDDSRPRIVSPGSLVHGCATLYRIAPDWHGAASFTVNGDHILVLTCHAAPSVALHPDLGWACQWLEKDCSLNRVSCRARYFDCEEQARAEVQRMGWKPFVWHVSVVDYLASAAAASHPSAFSLFQSGPVTFRSSQHDSLVHHLIPILHGPPSAAQLTWAAWYLGVCVTQLTASSKAVLSHDTTPHHSSPSPSSSSSNPLTSRLLRYRALFGEEVREELLHPSSSSRHPTHSFSFGDGSIAHLLLQSYGLINHPHIPQAWICDSIHVRRRILAGMLDGGGRYDDDSDEYDVCVRHRHTADGLKTLVGSLGLRNGAAHPQQQSSHPDESEECDTFSVSISGEMGEVERCCALIGGKRCSRAVGSRSVDDVPDSRRYGFSITQLPEADYYGFAVHGGINRRFLLHDFTVTHNVSHPHLHRTAQPMSTEAAEPDSALSVPMLFSSPLPADHPMHRLPLAPVPRAPLHRSVPGGCSAIHHHGLAARVREVGTRHERGHLRRQPPLARAHPHVRVVRHSHHHQGGPLLQIALPLPRRAHHVRFPPQG